MEWPSEDLNLRRFTLGGVWGREEETLRVHFKLVAGCGGEMIVFGFDFLSCLVICLSESECVCFLDRVSEIM